MKTVLVVDDDFDTRTIWLTVLQHRGYATLDAADGGSGIQMARDHQPDVIIMNMSMPKLDGIGATTVLREDPLTAHIPIIACTGFVREDGLDEAEDAGCDAYLEKPCEPSRVVEEVARFIGPPVAAGDAA
ncbi:MAG TPA: response regulator [Longimicrobiales bacterium]|nr:response regulator [Longimicrobiales bacterium]